jgi:hypothetical protein
MTEANKTVEAIEAARSEGMEIARKIWLAACIKKPLVALKK